MTAPTELTSDVRARLPPPFNTSTEEFELIAQGAESLLFRTCYLHDPVRELLGRGKRQQTGEAKSRSPQSSNPNAALKVRPEKKWRHPTLDKRLTRARILAEARILVKCRKDGVPVPGVLGLDWERGWLVTEWIEGGTVKDAIYRRDSSPGDLALKALLHRIGRAVGKLHVMGVVHGDLTTSNLMLQSGIADQDQTSPTSSLDGEIVLIDFGLSTQTVTEEDRAVDLYVLERAFGSTHPREEDFFDEVLKGYAESMGNAGKSVLRKLEDVRMRGRKKSMLG